MSTELLQQAATEASQLGVAGAVAIVAKSNAVQQILLCVSDLFNAAVSPYKSKKMGESAAIELSTKLTLDPISIDHDIAMRARAANGQAVFRTLFDAVKDRDRPPDAVDPNPDVLRDAVTAAVKTASTAELRAQWATLLEKYLIDGADTVHPDAFEMLKNLSPKDAELFKELAKQDLDNESNMIEIRPHADMFAVRRLVALELIRDPENSWTVVTDLGRTFATLVGIVPTPPIVDLLGGDPQ